MPKYCPVCDCDYGSWDALREHLKKAEAEGDVNHIDVIILEEWDLAAEGVPSEEDMT